MQEERIIRSVGDHWVVLVFPFFLFSLTLGFVGFLLRLSGESKVESLSFSLTVGLVGIGVAMVVVHWAAIFLLSRELSIWILTSKRIVTMEFLPYMKHDVEILPLAEMHEVEKKKHGLWANLLNYGEIAVNIGSIPKPLVFKKVPRPTELANVLGELYRLNHPERVDSKA